LKKYIYILFLSVTVFYSCEKEPTRSIEEELPTKNAIIIGSNPAGAKIYIAGKNTGQVTPDTIFWLRNGEVRVTLKLELFKDSSVTVMVNEKDTQSVFLDYTNNHTMMGNIYVDSNPRGAEIFLNDSSVNQVTPYKITNLMPGYYNLRLRKSQQWDYEKVVPVKSVTTNYIDCQMTDSIYWVNHSTYRTDIPTDYLTCVAIEKGFIKWVGTLNKGLLVYDDRTWKVFDMSNSILPDNKVNFIYIDPSNTKWICTDYGLVKIVDNDWTLYNTGNSGLPDNRISSVFNDGTRIWIGTYSKGVVTFDGSVWTEYNTQNWHLPSNRITYLTETWNARWICTDNGLFKYIDSTHYKIYNTSNTAYPGRPTASNCGFPTNKLTSVAVDKSGKAWVGCGKDGDITGGLSYERIVYFRCFRGKPSDEVFTIKIDANNVKWIGSSANGLTKLVTDGYTETWTHYNTYNSQIGSDRIYSIAIDNNGDKWIASFDGGLIKYKGN